MLGNIEDEIQAGDIEEDEDEEFKHDPNNEETPRSPLSHPGFALAEEYSNKLVNILKEIILNSNHAGAKAEYLLEELDSHEQPEYGDEVKIGVLGDSSVGKSSLINSILGTEDITVLVDSS